MRREMVALMLFLGVTGSPSALEKGCAAPLEGKNRQEEQRRDTVRVMFWNLENFFDWRNDSTSVSEGEFSALGDRHWTRKRFYRKCQAVAKGLLWAGSQQGGLPDAVGLAEVENAFVLRRLLQGTVLRKLDYRYVHFESGDSRGIDVALLYRSSRLQLVDALPCHLYEDSTRMHTRDILLARFRTEGGEELALLVNHHPSKYGGAAVSNTRRKRAVERLKILVDSLQTLGTERIVAMGDFNDTPDNPLYEDLSPPLVNLGAPLHAKGEGSIKYQGKWELIDLMFIWPYRGERMQVLPIPFLQCPDGAYAGTKPLRTYSGPRYLGGVSDHCPVWLELY